MLGSSLSLGRISNSGLKNTIELSWFQSPNSHINETRNLVLGLVHRGKKNKMVSIPVPKSDPIPFQFQF
jgi:hypothetical protein